MSNTKKRLIKVEKFGKSTLTSRNLVYSLKISLFIIYFAWVLGLYEASRVDEGGGTCVAVQMWLGSKRAGTVTFPV